MFKHSLSLSLSLSLSHSRACTGSTANGVGGSVDDDNVKLVTKAVAKESGKVAKQLKEERKKNDEENDSSSSDDERN